MISNIGADGIVESPIYWKGAIDREALPGEADDVDVLNARESDPVDDWFSYMVPTYNQAGPSCVGQSWANWIEGMVRRWVDPVGIPRKYQIDGEAIWKKGRQMFWDGDMSGGLYLDQGFHAAVELGYIPAEAIVKRVGQDWNSVNLALKRSPLVQGHIITKGWFQADPASGCIDHDKLSPDGTGAHATLLVATLRQPDKNGIDTRWRAFLNSWGADRGRFGFFLMTEAAWMAETMNDSPWTAEIPDIRAWTCWTKGLALK